MVGAYALTFASIMLACGMIGDELGSKKVMLAAAGCSARVRCCPRRRRTSRLLIAGRAVMGLGAAASEPGTLSICGTCTRRTGSAAGRSACGRNLRVRPRRRPGRPAASCVGAWSWRGIFWFNLGFGLAALIVAAIILPESADPTAARVDTAGTLLGAGALATLVFAIIDAETAGFGAPAVVALLCVGRGARPRVRLVGAAGRTPAARPAIPPGAAVQHGNVAAFCTYFATFAIFFFTALYLTEVAAASGYRLALVFLPMMVLMIAASLLAGRWTVRRAALVDHDRLPAVRHGLFLANGYLSPDPDYGPLMVALALAGIGIGTTVVPITSAVMSAVPPERSGMAASAANTSRVIGAATGVAVLGWLVNSQLRSSLSAQMNHLGVPVSFQNLVVNALETGQIPKNTSAYSGAEAGAGGHRRRVLGVPQRLARGAVPVCRAPAQVAGGILALITLRSQPVDAGS